MNILQSCVESSLSHISIALPHLKNYTEVLQK